MKTAIHLTLVLFAFLFSYKVSAQGIAINNSNLDPHSSAILDIASSNKGVLLPRLTAAQTASIASPATGLIVYVSDNPKGFYYYNGSDWVKFITKDQNGNVPINQSNSTADASAFVHIQPDAGNNKGLLIPRLTSAQTNSISTPANGLLVYITDNQKGFHYYNGHDWVKFITKDENGNVPINESGDTADHSAILHIQPDGGHNKGLLIPRLTAAQAGSIINPAIGLLVYITDNPRGFHYFNGIDWVKFITEDENGNVGIGCTAPQYKLHVIGDIASSGTVRGVNAYVTGAITACSDIRYKTNINPINNSLNDVMKMQGVTYNWKKDKFPEKNFSEDLQIGFIAQDMEKIIPQVVKTDVSGYKAIDYSRLTPVLAEAIKEQQKFIEELQTNNNDLKKEIAEIKAEIKHLKQVNIRLL